MHACGECFVTVHRDAGERLQCFRVRQIVAKRGTLYWDKPFPGGFSDKYYSGLLPVISREVQVAVYADDFW